MPEWVVNYAILPTALAGNLVGFFCIILGLFLLKKQLPELIRDGFTFDADPDAKIFKFRIQASLLLLLIGLVTLYFFTVGRVWELQKADPCAPSEIVKFGAFDGRGDPQLQKLVRGFNDLKRAKTPAELEEGGKYIGSVLASEQSRTVASVLRDYAIYISLDEKQRYAYCRLVNEGKSEDLSSITNLLNEGVPE